MEYRSCITFLYFLFCIFNLESLAYQIYYLEDANVCSTSKRTMKMNKRNIAFLIQLSKYPHVTEYAMDCHLEIEAPDNHGLQVIIEDINLRRNPLDNECDDYVWFGRDDDGHLSQKLCGERKLVPVRDFASISRPDTTTNPNFVESLYTDGQRATMFDDPGGELHIWFRKTSRKVEEHLQPLRLKLVITAYKRVCKANDSSVWSCPPISNKSKSQNICIASSLKCDGIVNCGKGLFSDETGCEIPTLLSSSAMSAGSLVVLGTVALLLSCLLGSLICFCRRRKARLRRGRNQEGCQVATLPIPHNSEVVAMERWRPPLSDEAPSKEDPPPSYADLFPSYAAVPQHSTDSN